VSLANGLVQRGHEVLFFADLYEEQTYVLDDMVQVMNLVPQTNSKLKKWGGAIRILRKQLKKDKPDVIIGIMSLCSVVAKLASIGMGIPVVATEHDSYERPDSAPMPFFINCYKFWICRMFTCVTVLTDADKKIIGQRLRNVTVMENPLALKPIENLSSRKKIILASGRVDNWHYKGFDVLIRAWGRVNGQLKNDNGKLSSNGEPWKLVIAGVWRNPETRTYLDGIAKECGVLDKIEYTGFVEDMQKLYAESSIFVLSSRYEAFGLVLIEAMSQGCACIACDYKGRQREILAPNEGECLDSSLKFQDSSVDGQKESEDTYVSNSKISQKQETAEGPQTRNLKPETRNRKFEACDTGILCEPDNVEALAEAMAKMITDDEYRESVRKNAIERSKYYSIENTMNRWESLLKQVTKTC